MYQEHKINLTKAGKAFWGTKKNSMRFVVTDKPVSLHGGYWDGGSREEYHAVGKSGSVLPLSYPTAPPQFGGGEAPSVALNDAFAIVRGGVFCGKVSHLSVYVTKLEGWFNPAHGTEVVK
jgi:hypothetical protein